VLVLVARPAKIVYDVFAWVWNFNEDNFLMSRFK
jgi:hypothetical protein